MSDLLEGRLKEKSRGPTDWQETFIEFYRASRRKILKVAFTVLSIYLSLFYTPLVWWIASPLKISQAPEKVDCIVVFAGGVGESGRGGQGYEERVEYTSNLYKQGYAEHLIFSSGYMYVFEEPLVMKALAVSLGVPEEAIILEDKAANTFQNVKFTKDILEEKDWNRILLVSSPYHMRRASLVVKKLAPEINCVYTPVPQSRFYSHGQTQEGKRKWKQINGQQIRAILHEYLGIVYYWSKGYI